MDSQIVELLGRNRLIGELLQAGLEVALPQRDRGIDLIAYMDLGWEEEHLSRFVACPIQMKAARGASFGAWQRYARFPNLVLVFIGYIEDPARTVTHALTHTESVRIVEAMGWAQTKSWIESHGYGTTKPGRELRALLEPHQMTPVKWRAKVAAISMKTN